MCPYLIIRIWTSFTLFFITMEVLRDKQLQYPQLHSFSALLTLFPFTYSRTSKYHHFNKARKRAFKD